MNIDKNEFRKYAVKHHRINSLAVDGFISRVDNSRIPTGMTPLWGDASTLESQAPGLGWIWKGRLPLRYLGKLLVRFLLSVLLGPL